MTLYDKIKYCNHLNSRECKKVNCPICWIETRNVKEFIEKILSLLDDDVNEREKYIAERIKGEAGDLE